MNRWQAVLRRSGEDGCRGEWWWVSHCGYRRSWVAQVSGNLSRAKSNTRGYLIERGRRGPVVALQKPGSALLTHTLTACKWAYLVQVGSGPLLRRRVQEPRQEGRLGGH